MVPRNSRNSDLGSRHMMCGRLLSLPSPRYGGACLRRHIFIARREVSPSFPSRLQQTTTTKKQQQTVITGQRTEVIETVLTPLELQSRFGDNPVKLQAFFPQLSPKRDCSLKRVCTIATKDSKQRQQRRDCNTGTAAPTSTATRAATAVGEGHTLKSLDQIHWAAIPQQSRIFAFLSTRYKQVLERDTLIVVRTIYTWRKYY